MPRCPGPTGCRWAGWSGRSTARPTRKPSGAAPAIRPKAVASASRCGSGRCPRRSSSGPHSWCSAANASSISDSTPTARTTRISAADSTAYRSSAVFPTPASPHTTSAAPCPPRTPSSSPSRVAHSPPRPRSTCGKPCRAGLAATRSILVFPCGAHQPGTVPGANTTGLDGSRNSADRPGCAGPADPQPADRILSTAAASGWPEVDAPGSFGKSIFRTGGGAGVRTASLRRRPGRRCAVP